MIKTVKELIDYRELMLTLAWKNIAIHLQAGISWHCLGSIEAADAYAHFHLSEELCWD